MMQGKDYKSCPFCGEEIKAAAIKCRYCLSMLEDGDGWEKLKSKAQAEGFKGEEADHLRPLGEFLENKYSPYPKSPLLKRLVAFIVDLIIGSLVFLVMIPVIVFMVIMRYDPFRTYTFGYTFRHFSWQDFFPIFGLVIFSFFLLGMIWFLLYSLFKDGFQGASLGKRLTGLIVVNLKENKACGAGLSALRNFIKLVLTLVPYVGWLVEPVMVLAHEKGQRLGDLAAGTQVVEREVFLSRQRVKQPQPREGQAQQTQEKDTEN